MRKPRYCATCGYLRTFRQVEVRGVLYDECTVCGAHASQKDYSAVIDIKDMVLGILAGLFLLAAPVHAVCGENTYCFNALDQHVPAYLAQMGEAAEQARIAKFFRKLDCWSWSTDDGGGEIVCRDGGQDIKYKYQRDPLYEVEPVTMFVPAGL